MKGREQLKKFVISAAAVLTAAVMLTGCTDYGTDYAKEYKEFFDYTFDGKYEISEPTKTVENEDTDHEFGKSEFTIKYTDKNGNAHCDVLTSYGGSDEWTDFDERYSILCWLDLERMQIAEREFYEKLAKKYFPINDETILDTSEKCDDFRFIGEKSDGYKVTIYITDALVHAVSDDKNTDILDEALSNESGIKLSDCDLKSFVSQKETVTSFIIVCDDEKTAESSVKKIKKLEKDFIDYAESPHNYIFQVSVMSDEEDKADDIIYRKIVIMDEETEYEEKGMTLRVLDALGIEY